MTHTAAMGSQADSDAGVICVDVVAVGLFVCRFHRFECVSYTHLVASGVAVASAFSLRMRAAIFSPIAQRFDALLQNDNE